ncbi:MAG: DUF5330 domain-containing protein [Mesorhizobium sp.]|nr:DUF5330 domain-containing protein [Mesorhizobium sp.]MBN9244198.1 DUF5330 domain-containing protein [Mesorhizobium sp.]MBN9274048.1 DUF5330 domain-containing protein [Mesorhizobium sp.]
MGFLIKAAFWFSLVLLALPLGTSGNGTDQPSVGPLEALAAAREAVGDIAGICERKPDVCVTGKSALYTIATRARETARIAGSMLDDGAGQADATTAEAKADTKIITGSVPAKN